MMQAGLQWPLEAVLRTLGAGSGNSFGVHIEFMDLWYAMVYLTMIWVLGFIFERVLFCPALVGQIAAGILFGPQLANIVPFAEAFVLFGEIGLVLLVIEAGVDIDVTTLKLIGKRGVIIATLGSIFPIAIGLGIAMALGAETKAAIAAGAAFGPTSLGIAMNILKTGKIINTPTGQLIVAAAIIDDMIALIILSQLGGLVGDITVAKVLIPIVSALGFLLIGGYLALMVIPGLLDRFIFKEGMNTELRGKISLGILIALTIGLMQATNRSKASHLMGAFIAGLVFCTDHALHVTFVSQFKRVLQWLLRIFFASTIGFQVPIKHFFGSGKIIWQGLVFTVALLGKLFVGFLVPNFSPQDKNFTGNHLRDCLIVGCSMAAEGEFAFVIAAFSVENELIDEDLYASIVFAILLSTIIAPFSLRFTINYFNKRSMEAVIQAEEEMKLVGFDDILASGILEGTTVFYCINTTSHASWGTLPALMRTMFKLNLEVIDHRSWHSRFESTVINEVYVKGIIQKDTLIEEEIDMIESKVKEAIKQEDAIVTVNRWVPGVVSALVESTHQDPDGGVTHSDHNNIAEAVANEARKKLDKSEHQAQAPSHDTLKTTNLELGTVMEGGEGSYSKNNAMTRSKRVKVTSTPMGGGVDIFSGGTEVFQPVNPLGHNRRRRMRAMSTPISGDLFGDTTPVILGPGEILVNVTGPDSQKYAAKMKEELYKKMSTSSIPLTLVEEKKENFGIQYLDGFVRRPNNQRSLSIASANSDKGGFFMRSVKE